MIKTIIRIVLLIIAFYFTINFTVIISNNAARNIGSFVRVTLSLLVGVYALFMSRINTFLADILKTKSIGRNIVITIFIMLCTIAIIALLETIAIVKANYSKLVSSTPPVILVLGCRVQDGHPSLMLNERIDAAYECLVQNPESCCIVSGGQGEDESISEAKCMFDELTARGIDPSRIYMDDRSTSTRENFLYSLEIIKDNNLGDSVIIVTNNYHELRAQMIAKEFNLNCGAFPARTSMWLLPAYYIRELFGVLQQISFN